MLRNFIRTLVVLLPWSLRRWVLQHFFGYSIHPSARIGWSWIFPQHLRMGENASIGHGNVAIHLERIEMGSFATIGRSNWITGCPKDGLGRHFLHQPERDPALFLGEHSAITKNHHLDCTARIEIGAFTTIAGYASQFLTHSIDIAAGRQHAKPIRIGRYCFVGTRCVVLGEAVLPDSSVLGAAALLNKPYADSFTLYAGVPARPVKELPRDASYFQREKGFVE